MKKQVAFVLRARDRTGVEGILRDGNIPQKIVKRAKIVLMTADGAGVMTCMRAVGISKTTVWRWQDYFVEAVSPAWSRDVPNRPARGRSPTPSSSRSSKRQSRNAGQCHALERAHDG
jgi:Homeodomain-like domain